MKVWPLYNELLARQVGGWVLTLSTDIRVNGKLIPLDERVFFDVQPTEDMLRQYRIAFTRAANNIQRNGRNH